MAKFKEVIEIKGDLSDIKKKLNQLNNRLDRVGKDGEKATKRIGRGFTALKATIAGAMLTAVIAFKGLIKSASELQTEMTNVRTLTKWNNEEFRIMTETIQKLSRIMPSAARELAAGLYQVVSATVPVNQQLRILELSARAGTAGIASTTDALNLGAAVIKAYGLEWKEFEAIQDQAFKTVELGQTTFGELASALPRITAGMSAMKISTQELFGALATLTGVTGNTNEVSTQLRAIMTSLTKPREAMIKLAENQEYASVQEMIATEGLIGLMKILREEVGDDVLALGKLFESQEAITGVMALMGEQYDALIDKTNQITEANGAMNEAFEIQINTFSNQVKMLANKMKPAMVGFIGTLTDLLKAMNDILNVSIDEQYRDERIELSKLFAVAKDVTADVEVRANAIKTLNTRYGHYLPNLLTEKSSLQDIQKAQNAISVAMLKRMAIEVREEQIKERLAKIDKLRENQPDLILRRQKATNKLAKSISEQSKAEIELNRKVMGNISATEASTVAGKDAILMAGKYAETVMASGTSVHKNTVELKNATTALSDNKQELIANEAEIFELINTTDGLTKSFEKLYGLTEEAIDIDIDIKDPEDPESTTEEFTKNELAILQAFQNNRYIAKVNSYAKELELLNTHETEVVAVLKKAGEDQTAVEEHFAQRRIEIELAVRNAKLGIYSDIAGALASLVGISSKNAKLLAKIQAVQATIDAFSAAQTALAQTKLPPPFPFIAYGVTLTAGLAGAAQVLAASNKLKMGGILTGPVYSPLLKGGAIAGEAGREAIIPLDQKGGIFGDIKAELKLMNKNLKKLDRQVNITSEIDGVEFVRETVEPSSRKLGSRRW